MMRHGADRALYEEMTAAAGSDRGVDSQLGRTMVVEGDLSDSETLCRAMDGCSIVFHVAGVTLESPGRGKFSWNTKATEWVAGACRSMSPPPTLVFVSSLAASGVAEGGSPRRESEPPRPVSEYGHSKLAAEERLRAIAAEVPISIVRPPMVLGPGDRLGIKMFRAIWMTNIHVTPTWSKRCHAVVAVEDLATVLVRAGLHGRRLIPVERWTKDADRGVGIYHMATGLAIEYGELGRMVARSMGRRWCFVLRLASPITRLVVSVVETGGALLRCSVYLNRDKYREITVGSWNCDGTKVAGELGFTPVESLVDRIAATTAWYRKHRWF